MPRSWTLHTLDMPIAAFMEAPNIWTWLTLSWLLVIILSVDKLQRKLDRIMKHLGLEEESRKPAPAPTALQIWAQQVWAHPRMRPLGRLVGKGIVRTGRFIDRLLDRPPAGKSPVQDEV
jgi:hypothetical protein